MTRTHPHAEASYKVIALDDGSFGVEVSIPDSHPTTVTSFASEQAAEAWIGSHRRRVQSQSESRYWLRAQRGRSPRSS